MVKLSFEQFEWWSNKIIWFLGAKYKRHVSVAHPLFRGNKILIHFDTIINCIDELLVRWREIDDLTNEERT